MDRNFWNYDGGFVAGTSMLPLFRFGFIFWKHGRMPKVGDLVCYRSEGYDEEGRFNPKKKGNVCHRCIGIEGDIFLIKGDNRDYVEKVPKKDIQGTVIKAFKIF
jgi:hypothetical protein